MIRTYRSKDQRRKATEKEMLLWVARKDDLQLVLRLEQGMRGVEETQDRAARSSQSCRHAAPRDPAWLARLQVVWVQQGGSVGIGR